MLAALGVLVAPALALSPGESLTLTLAGGVQVEGHFRSSDGRVLVLNVDGESLTVDLALIEAASRDGLPLPVDTLAAEARAWSEGLVDPGRPVPPLAAGLASAIWPGSGHLLLRDRKTWAGYATVDAALLGLSAWFLFREQSPRAAATFAAIDLVFRGYAVSEAVRDARRRRPAETARRGGSLPPCRTAVSVAPVVGGGVAATAGVSCGASAHLDPTAPIH